MSNADGSIGIDVKPLASVNGTWASFIIADVPQEYVLPAGSNSADTALFATLLSASRSQPMERQMHWAKAAAGPQVSNLAEQRYSGQNGAAQMASDARAVAGMTAAVANNPAARALGGALLRQALAPSKPKKRAGNTATVIINRR